MQSRGAVREREEGVEGVTEVSIAAMSYAANSKADPTLLIFMSLWSSFSFNLKAELKLKATSLITPETLSRCYVTVYLTCFVSISFPFHILHERTSQHIEQNRSKGIPF